VPTLNEKRISVEHGIRMGYVRELRKKNKSFYGSTSSFRYRIRNISGSISRRRSRFRLRFNSRLRSSSRSSPRYSSSARLRYSFSSSVRARARARARNRTSLNYILRPSSDSRSLSPVRRYRRQSTDLRRRYNLVRGSTLLKSRAKIQRKLSRYKSNNNVRKPYITFFSNKISNVPRASPDMSITLRKAIRCTYHNGNVAPYTRRHTRKKKV
jgi:hypothetical protein